MKDGPVRRTIKRIALIRYQFDLWVARKVRNRANPPRYRLGGTCQGCGLCCETPMIQTIGLFRRLRTTRWIILTWHRVINGFEHLKDDPKTNSFVFRCNHFDPETRKCDTYDSRPGMCRDYPRNLLDSPFPEFLDRCGFHALDKNADSLNAALEKLDLPDEKLEELKKKLHTKESRLSGKGSQFLALSIPSAPPASFFFLPYEIQALPPHALQADSGFTPDLLQSQHAYSMLHINHKSP